MSVTLRPLVEADWAAAHAWGSDPEVCRWQPWGPNREAESRAYARRAEEDNHAVPRVRWVLAVCVDGVDRAVGPVVGAVEVNRVDQHVVELGWVLRRDHWGRGLATSAARQVAAIAFGELDAHRVAATCDPRNAASAAVIARLGMTWEGRLREVKQLRDGWRDSDVYSLLAHEWTGGRST